MRGSRESLLYRESVLRALNRKKNVSKGSWKGMTPEEAYRGLLEEVLELGQELFRPHDMLDYLRWAKAFSQTIEFRDDIDPQRVREEYDDIGGAHLILGDVAGCLAGKDKPVTNDLNAFGMPPPSKEYEERSVDYWGPGKGS